MRRRRVVRTFHFDRILAFVIFVCFAVAMVCVALSFNMGAPSIVVKGRSLYVVTYARCASESEAKLKSEECFASGGAGNVVPDGDDFLIAASAYTSYEEALTVAERLDGSSVKEIALEKLKFVSSSASELAADAAILCYVTFANELSECASELDAREVSEAVAVERCKLCLSEASRLLRLASAQMSLSATSPEEKALLSATVELLSEAAALLKDTETGEGLLTSRIRRAFVALALKTRDFSKGLK